MGNFLPHLSDTLRQKIAVKYAQHEFRKLLPKLRGNDIWKSIDVQIESWPHELGPANFWNGVHGISIGFRLKSLVPWITSLHINWGEEDLSVEGIRFGNDSWRTKKFDPADSPTEERDNDPIFVLEKDKGLVVIDGNRRLLKARDGSQKLIASFVGRKIKDPPLFEHWVPTSLLVDLVFWHKRQYQEGRDNTESIAKTIAELVRNSQAGKLEFKNHAIHQDDEIHRLLFKAVENLIQT